MAKILFRRAAVVPHAFITLGGNETLVGKQTRGDAHNPFE